MAELRRVIGSSGRSLGFTPGATMILTYCTSASYAWAPGMLPMQLHGRTSFPLATSGEPARWVKLWLMVRKPLESLHFIGLPPPATGCIAPAPLLSVSSPLPSSDCRSHCPAPRSRRRSPLQAVAYCYPWAWAVAPKAPYSLTHRCQAAFCSSGAASERCHAVHP